MSGGEFALGNNLGEEFIIVHNDNSGAIKVNSRDLNTVTVDTIADLRTLSSLAEYVRVTGYHTKNDGAFGSNVFRLKGIRNTENDNTGTIILATINNIEYVYELQFSGFMLAKFFGHLSEDIPTQGVWLNGIAIFSNSFSAGGHAGYLCTSSGEPGVWKPFGKIEE